MSSTSGHSSAKSAPRPPVFSDQEIRQVIDRDSASIARWTHTVAKERGIRVRPRPNDRFVKAVSPLSDGVVDLDHVEELLVELGPAGALSSYPRGLFSV